MKLLADDTLGRLAKWLRILGYDAAYLRDTDDYAVMRLARAEDRLILTRDHHLAGRGGVRTLLVSSKTLKAQLRQVMDAVGPPPDPDRSRCPVCNETLAEAAPELLASRLPTYVKRTHQHFSVCPVCDRIYWQGTHWQRMRALVTKLRNDTGPDKMGTA